MGEGGGQMVKGSVIINQVFSYKSNRTRKKIPGSQLKEIICGQFLLNFFYAFQLYSLLVKHYFF